MNFKCKFCQQPANRICCHQKCNKCPFLCEGECVSGAAAEAHDHDNNSSLRIVSTQDFSKFLLQTQATIRGKYSQETKYQIVDIQRQLEGIHKDFQSQLAEDQFTGGVKEVQRMLRILTTGGQEAMNLQGHEIWKIQNFENSSEEWRNADQKMNDKKERMGKLIANISMAIESYHRNPDVSLLEEETGLKKRSRMSQIRAAKKTRRGAFTLHPSKCLNQPKMSSDSGKESNSGTLKRRRNFIVEESEQSDESEEYKVGQEFQKIYKKAIKHHDNNNFKRAKTYYDMCLDIDPDHVDSLNGKGMSLHDMRRFRQALECLNKVIDIVEYSRNDQMDPDHYMNRAEIHLSLNDLHCALTDINTAINLNSQNSVYLNLRGKILHKLKRHSEALEDFGWAIILDSSQSEYFRNKGLVHEDMGEFGQAIDEFGRGLGNAVSPEEEKEFQEDLFRAEQHLPPVYAPPRILIPEPIRRVLLQRQEFRTMLSTTVGT